jgi:hypothetical protein
LGDKNKESEIGGAERVVNIGNAHKTSGGIHERHIYAHMG